MTFQVWFTTRELAEFVRQNMVQGVPSTQQGFDAFAKRQGWNDQPVTVARRRAGSVGGGGMEYHITLFPDRLQMAIRQAQMAAALAEQHSTAVDVEKRRADALAISSLSARARSVMEARAEVLRSIEGYAHAQGRKVSWSIGQFLTAQDRFIACQELQKRRDRGEILTEAEYAQLGRVQTLVADDGFALAPETLSRANNRGPRAPTIGRSAIYDWFAARDKDGIAALAPRPAKTNEPIPVEFVAFLKHWAVPAKVSIPEAHKDYMAAHSDPARALTLTQVEYIVAKKLDNIQKHIGREGILTLRSRLPYITRTTEDLWPTTVYTADGKTFDAEVADPVSGRAMKPEITSVIDVATRKCVGFAVSRKENVIAVSEALRRACLSHGIPAIFYTDRGAGYKNKTFDGQTTPDAAVGGLMARLHIAKMHALPYNSQAKGIVERFNAQWNSLAKTFPTYLGADMDKEASQKAHKTTRREIAEFGHSRLLPSWDDFIARVEARIEDYNDRPHEGLPKIDDPQTGRRRHMSPNEAWAAHVAQGWEPVPLDTDEADDLFRPYEVRVVRRGLVTWNTNDYFHQSLERYHEARVMVGYDLHQADRVWVRDFDAETGQPGRLICVAEFGGNSQRYIPLTMQQAAEENRTKGKLKRLDLKREAALDELRAPMLEHRPTASMPQFHQPPTLRVVPSSAPPEAEPAPVAQEPAAPTRRIITSDAELAQLVIENPEELTPGRARLLREAMALNSGRELLKISGVDLDALDRVLRSAA
jgi:putative transposase